MASDGHECWIAVKEEHMREIQDHSILRMSYFGGTCVPIKNCPEDAVKAFMTYNEAKPKWVIRFKIPFRLYYLWMHSRTMTMTPPNVNGYRIHTDVRLLDFDTEWTMHEAFVGGVMLGTAYDEQT